MPSKDELDSPATVIGEEEYFPTLTEKELTQLCQRYESRLAKVKEKLIRLGEENYLWNQEWTKLAEQLADGGDYIFNLEAELENVRLDYADYKKLALNESRILRQSLKDLCPRKLNQIKRQAKNWKQTSRGKDLAIAYLQCDLEQRDQELSQVNSELSSKTYELSNLNSLLSDKGNQISELKQQIAELEQIAQNYWQSSQTEIKHWQNVADTHAEALQTAEIWNKRKWDRLDTEKQNLIQIINQKNNELDELEIEAGLTDFHNSRESSQQINLLREEITRLNQELIKLGEETNDLSQELTQEEELVDLKDHRLDNLTETIQTQTQKIDQLTKSRQQKQKIIDFLTIQLGKDQSKNKDLTELLTKREKEFEQLINRQATLQQKLKRTKTYQQNRNDNLETKNQTLTGKLTYYADQDDRLRGTIQDLQDQINNHTCSANCSLLHLPTSHVCPIVQQVNCSHSNYASLQSQLSEKEKIIQEQAQRIRELENKPPVVETRTPEVEKEILVEKPINTPLGESLEKIVETDLNSLEKELEIELSSEVKEAIKKATSYQQLSSIRNREFKSYLTKIQADTATIQPNQAIIKPNQNERIILIGLLAISLISIGGLLLKLKKKSLTKE